MGNIHLIQNLIKLIRIRQLKMQKLQKKSTPIDQLQRNAEQIKKSHLIEQRIKESIKIIGDQSRYQLTIIIFLTLCFFLVTYQLLNTSFYFMNPVFQCDGEPTLQADACKKLQRCVVVNDYTITAQNKLYCDRKSSRNLIQSVYGVGSMVGVVFVNFVSDLQGRKFSLILSLVMQVLSLVLLLLSASYDIIPLMVFAEILTGFSSGSFLSVSYVFTDKVMSKRWADRSILITNGVGTLSEITIILFSNYSNWRVLALYVVLIPTVFLVIFAYFFITEDAILLYSKHKFAQCQRSLAKMAKINKTEKRLPQCLEVVQQLKEQNIVLDSENFSFLKKLSYLKIVASKRILIPAMLLASHALGGNFYYYALNYAISNVGSSYGLNIFLFGIAEFLGMFPLIIIGNKVPRKLGEIILVSSVVATSLFFFLDLSTIMQTILLVLARFILMSQYAIYIYLAVESFPQHIQSTVFGIIELFGQSGKLVAPYSINIAESWKLNPIAVMGIMLMILSLTPLFFLKQTLKPEAKKNLSESMISENEQESTKDLDQGLLVK